MTTHGSAFQVAAKALLDELGDRVAMSDWKVRYDSPRHRDELHNAAGAQMAIWVDPDGSSTFEVTSFPTGYTEVCSLSVVFQHSDMESTTQEAVDDVVAEAVGELVDMVTDDPRLSGAMLPDGWDIASVVVTGTERVGDVMTDKPGAWRVVTVDLDVTVTRC